MKRVSIQQMWKSNWIFSVRLFLINYSSSLSILVKPIIRFYLNEKEILEKNLTIIENTFELVRCQISANPSIVPEIQWLKNEQLILGEINIDRSS